MRLVYFCVFQGSARLIAGTAGRLRAGIKICIVYLSVYRLRQLGSQHCFSAVKLKNCLRSGYTANSLKKIRPLILNISHIKINGIGNFLANAYFPIGHFFRLYDSDYSSRKKTYPTTEASGNPWLALARSMVPRRESYTMPTSGVIKSFANSVLCYILAASINVSCSKKVCGVIWRISPYFS